METLWTLKFSARLRLVKSSNLRFQFSSDALTRSLSEVEVERLWLVVGVSDIVMAFKQEFVRIYLGRAERPTCVEREEVLKKTRILSLYLVLLIILRLCQEHHTALNNSCPQVLWYE